MKNKNPKPSIKKELKSGKKIATKEMMKNNDYLYLKPNSNTVIRTWGGNETIIGDKYFSWELPDWYEVE